MSRCLAGIQGVPFRAIEMRRKAPGSRVWVETLSCGHEHIIVQRGRYDPPFGTKRRCYSCKVIADRRSKHQAYPTRHWELPPPFGSKHHYGAFCGNKNATETTRMKEHVTCLRCLKLMELHEHVKKEQ